MRYYRKQLQELEAEHREAWIIQEGEEAGVDDEVSEE